MAVLNDWPNQGTLLATSQLVGHHFPLLPLERDQGFARVYAGHVARQGNHLDTIQELVGRVVADGDRRCQTP